MKYVIALSLLTTVVVVEARTMSSAEFNIHLEQYRGNGGIALSGIPPSETLQDLAFLLYVAEDWQRALTLLETADIDRWQQAMIIVAAEFLSPKDYVRFLSGVCGLTESGKLEFSSWDVFVTGAACAKAYFLQYNYDQPEVAAVIDRMEALSDTLNTEDHRQYRLDYFSKIKSGELKKDIILNSVKRDCPLPESYKDNSNMAYRLLEGEHAKLLVGGKSTSMWGEGSEPPAEPEELEVFMKRVRRRLEKEYKNLMAEEASATVRLKGTSWNLPLLIGVASAFGAVALATLKIIMSKRFRQPKTKTQT